VDTNNVAQQKSSLVLNQFVRGLITEATALTFPENASYDELNMELLRNGSRRRRRGIKREAGTQPLPTYGSIGLSIDDVARAEVTMYKWESVGGDPDLNLVVLQFGRYLAFFDASVSPMSAGMRSEIIDLNTYSASSDIPGVAKCQFTAGKGMLFVASPEIQPLYIKYEARTATLTPLSINLLIRDFEGLDDGLGVDERPATLSPLMNTSLSSELDNVI